MYLELRNFGGREEEEEGGECHVCAMPGVTVDQLKKVEGRRTLDWRGLLSHWERTWHVWVIALCLHSNFPCVVSCETVPNFECGEGSEPSVRGFHGFVRKSSVELECALADPHQNTPRFLTPFLHFASTFAAPKTAPITRDTILCLYLYLYLQFTSFLHPDAGNTRLLVRRRKSLETLEGSETKAPLGGELEELPLEKKVADVVAAGWKFPGNFVSMPSPADLVDVGIVIDSCVAIGSCRASISSCHSLVFFLGDEVKRRDRSPTSL